MVVGDEVVGAVGKVAVVVEWGRGEGAGATSGDVLGNAGGG